MRGLRSTLVMEAATTSRCWKMKAGSPMALTLIFEPRKWWPRLAVGGSAGAHRSSAPLTISHDSGGRNFFGMTSAGKLNIFLNRPLRSTLRGSGSHFIRNPMASTMGYMRSPLSGAEVLVWLSPKASPQAHEKTAALLQLLRYGLKVCQSVTLRSLLRTCLQANRCCFPSLQLATCPELELRSGGFAL